MRRSQTHLSLPGQPGIGAARRAVGRALELGVAEAAVAAFEEHDALAGVGEIGQHRLVVLVDDLGAHGHAQHDIVAARAGAVAAHAVVAALGLEMLLVAVVDQGVEIVGALEDDVAAATAIAAVGPADIR